MWSYVLTKPKQGKALCEDMAVLINWPFDYKDSEYFKEFVMISGATKKYDFPCTKKEK